MAAQLARLATIAVVCANLAQAAEGGVRGATQVIGTPPIGGDGWRLEDMARGLWVNEAQGLQATVSRDQDGGRQVTVNRHP